LVRSTTLCVVPPPRRFADVDVFWDGALPSFSLSAAGLHPCPPRRDDANGREAAIQDTTAMAVQGLTGTEDERAGRRLIEQMGTILTGLRDDMPDGFAAALFGHAATEDLLAYEAREL